MPAWLIPLAVRAARQRVGCRHADIGAVAVPSMSYETAVQRYVCLYESYAIIKTTGVIYRILEHVFERRYRPSTTRTGLQAAPVDSTRTSSRSGYPFYGWSSLSLTLNPSLYCRLYCRLSTLSFLCAYSHVTQRQNVFSTRRLAGPRHISPTEV